MNNGLISNHYQGERGRKYVEGRQDILNHLGYRLQSSFYLPHLKSEDEVLDFGCANGSLAMALKPKIRRIVGLEVNEHSRRLAEGQGLEVYSSLDDLPKGQLFDKIISNHVLEHIPNVFGVLSILREHLKINGQLIVIVPIEDFREKRNLIWRENEYNRHLYTWTPLLFGNLLSEAGFTPLRLEVITQAWSPKLFFLGDGVIQRIAGFVLSVLKKRRQLLAVATRCD